MGETVCVSESMRRLVMVLLGLLALTLIVPMLTAPAAQAAPKAKRQPAKLETRFVTGKSLLVKSCWSGGAGQVGTLSARSTAGATTTLANTVRLVRSRSCPKDYPLQFKARFTTPTPGTWIVTESVRAGKGYGAGQARTLRLRVPGAWTASEVTCARWLWSGSQLNAILRDGPGLNPSTVTSRISRCDSRIDMYPQTAVDAEFAAYRVDSSAVPDARTRLIIETLSDSAFRSLLVAEAQARYPGIARDISSTRTTLDVVSAYADVIGQNLETVISDPYSDPLVKEWIFVAVPTSRNSAETAIRKDPRWEYTQRGQWSYLAAGYGLLCAFGFTENCTLEDYYNAKLASLPPMLPRWPLF